MGCLLVYNDSTRNKAMDDQHTLDFQIANTLEKIQHINPVLYGMWYSKLYPPHGDNKHWTAETLTHLNNLLK
jgi:hypothetical protein